MKITDYAPRAAEFDTYLKPGMVGIEIGVDVGAHAEAMLLYNNVSLTLVDIWDNKWIEGYCHGRLAKYRGKVEYVQQSAEKFISGKKFDFIYFDLPQTYELTKMMLERWKHIPLIGYRGSGFPEIARAAKEVNRKVDFLSFDIIIQ